MVKFSAVNTAQNPTFNVNNTGAKPVFYNTAVVTTGTLWAGGNTRPARYVYDGTNWVWMGQAIDSNTTYTAMSKAELTTGTATTLRTVRADYLKAGIEELIDGKLPTVPTKLSDLNDDATHRTVSDTEKSTWNGKANASDIPTALSQLTADSTHRVVTDTEKTTWNGKANKKTQLSAFYGTCTTDAATQAKTATITDSDGNFSLRAGVNIFIKFTNTNSFSVTADTPITLNVNNTGAKQIRGAATAVLTGTNTTFYGRANYINQYVYDGTYWVWVGSSTDNNTTYSNMSTAELTTGTATTQRTVRADYLKAGINSLIDTKIAGKADKSLLEDGDDHFQFGVDSDGNYGYVKSVGGADTVIPFKTVGTRSGSITSNGTYTAKTDISKDGYESVTVAVPQPTPNLQSKTVTAGTANVTVSPDASYDGLSSVVVQPTPSQTKSVTPSTSAQTVSPDSGKLLSSVSVAAISTQTKSATPSTSAQTVSPDSGKYLSSVSVAAIPNLHITNSMIVPRWGTSPGSSVPATQVATRNPRVDFNNSTTYGSAEMIEIAMPAGYYSWSYGNSSCCIPTETKTVTAGTSATTVTPTNYNTSSQYVKFLKSVTVNPTPSQEKTITASRSAQTVTPDSGKLLSKVTVNKYPDASGTYTPSANSTASDMGATNNYRYVNTSTVYNLGYKAGWNAAKKWAVDNYLARAPYSTGGSIYGATADMSSTWPYSERHFAAGLNLISGDLYLSINSSKTAWEYDIRLTKDA